MSRLNNKIAVITGGATGIGFAAAKRFIDEGAVVYIFGRRQDALDKAVAELGSSARAVRGSVTDQSDIDRLFDTVKAEHGRVDVLFANAGTATFAPLGDVTAEHYDGLFDLNVKGLIFTVQTALTLMAAGSSVILTGSSLSAMGSPGASVYAATKAAVRALVRSWVLDLKGAGVRFNVLSPGPVRTELTEGLFDDAVMNEVGASTVVGRVGDPAEIGAAAAFLASADSSFMTGAEVFVDGGVAQV